MRRLAEQMPTGAWPCAQIQEINYFLYKNNGYIQGMANRKPSPLQASFWLSEQEKRYILVICTIFLLGLVVRYWYLKHDKPREYLPKGIEKVEQRHE